MYYSMYIYTHTVGYCEKPGEADTQSTTSLTSISMYSSVISSKSSIKHLLYKTKTSKAYLTEGKWFC